MTLEEIKSAVEAGKTVFWSNRAYRVLKDSLGQWLIVCDHNGYCIGLTWRDGVTMNGKPEDFFVEKKNRLVLGPVFHREDGKYFHAQEIFSGANGEKMVLLREEFFKEEDGEDEFSDPYDSFFGEPFSISEEEFFKNYVRKD